MGNNLFNSKLETFFKMLVSFQYAAAAAYEVQIKETETIGAYMNKAASYYKIDIKKCTFKTSSGITVTAGMTSAQYASAKSSCGGKSASAASSQKVVIKISYSGSACSSTTTAAAKTTTTTAQVNTSSGCAQAQTSSTTAAVKTSTTTAAVKTTSTTAKLRR